HWQRHNFKDYETLLDQWEKYFPTDERLCLCAKLELGTSDTIAIGEHQGEKKRLEPEQLSEEEAAHLLAIIKAQASTEFGSIQQHAGTLERADDDQDRFWVLRVMAEELRHGYQMLHLLLSKDWSHVSRGVSGEPNVRFGFKDLKNREAQDQYIEEVQKMLRDINLRFIRARFPAYAPEQADAALAELERARGTHHGVRREDLLRTPDRRFFRRKGEPAFSMVGVDGEPFTDAEEYLRYLSRHLNEGYVASRDMRNYAEALRGVAAGTLAVKDAIMKMPKLKRVGGTCPCSKGVRWVMDGSAADQAASA